MSNRWITLPARDVYLIFPLGIFDKHIEIIFGNLSAIDTMIDQLRKIRSGQ